MPEDFKPGCARPTGGPVGEKPKKTKTSLEGEEQKQMEVQQQMIQVGQKAPDFTAPAYYQGKFVTINLSEYIGKWVLLCFYPGDFTFV